MKKSLLLSISCLVIMFLSACTDNFMEPIKNNMILSIINNASFDFYSCKSALIKP